MRRLILGTVAALSLLAVPPAVGAAPLSPTAQLLFGGDRLGDGPAIEPVQYFYGGQNYCWYFNGWRGPGYYWCGYAWRNGLGWGGGRGWHGWRGRGGWGRGGGFHRGGHMGFHGGRFHGGGFHGGDGGHGGGDHHGR